MIGVAILVSASALLMMYALVGREPRVASQSTLLLRPNGELQETMPDDVFGFMRPDVTTVRGFVENLRKAGL